jgi:threonyl-tRNA synthetase
LREAGLRAEVDERGESVGKKIRDAELRKVPYMLVVGDKEAEAGEVAVRRHTEGDLGSETVDAFVKRATAAILARE